MGLLDRLRSAFGRASDFAGQVKAVTRIIMFGSFEKFKGMDISWRDLLQYGYKGNSAVWACIQVYVDAFGEGESSLFRRIGQQDNNPATSEWQREDHEVNSLLAIPNPNMAAEGFWRYIIVYEALGGEAFAWIEESEAGLPIALWPMHVGQITPMPGEGGEWISHYVYDPGDNRDKIAIPPSRMLHFKWAPDPDRPWRGQSPLVAVRQHVDTDTEIARFGYLLLKNHAVPQTLISTKAQLDDDVYDRLVDDWQRKHGGSNRGGIAVVDENEVTVTRVGAGLDEFDATVLYQVPETRIAAAFGVPAVIVGLYVGIDLATNRATVEGLHNIWVQHRLVPKWRAHSSELSRKLLPYYGLDPVDYSIQRDLSTISALAKIQQETVEALNVAVQGGWLPVSEAQARAGFRVDPEGDYYLRIGGGAITYHQFGEPMPEPEPELEEQPGLPNPFAALLGPPDEGMEEEEEAELEAKALRDRAGRGFLGSPARSNDPSIRRRIRDQAVLERRMAEEVGRALLEMQDKVVERVESLEDL